MKRDPTSLAITETQIKPQRKVTAHPVAWQKKSKSENTVCENVEQGELTYTTGGSGRE